MKKRIGLMLEIEDYNYLQSFSKVMCNGDVTEKILEEYLKFAIQSNLPIFYELTNEDREKIEIEQEKLNKN